MPHPPESEASSIVVRGQFSPAIIQPSWLSANHLIPEAQADEAEIKIIHPKIALFTADWLEISVTEDRFGASTKQEAYFELLRDLVHGVFDILDQTPIKALGLNRAFHFSLGSEENWNNAGYRLVPQENWTDFLKRPGLRSLTEEGLRTDSYKGYLRVKVEPSNLITHGLFIDVNDHYQLAETDPVTPGTNILLTIISENWDDSMVNARNIADRLVAYGD